MHGVIKYAAEIGTGVLLLVMDLSKRAWSGSKRAKLFYKEQQRLWIELLMRFLPDRATVEEVLQVFQGAVPVAHLDILLDAQ